MSSISASLNRQGEPRSASHWPRQAAGYLIAIACLAWIFHDVSLREIRQDMAGIRWLWVVPAILFDILSYFCQGIRWGLLLGSPRIVSPIKTTQAIYAGLFTNEILPMRVGEVVRAYLVSRWMAIDMARIIPSMAIGRFFDGIWLVLAIGVASIFVPLPKDLMRAGDILGTLLLAASIGFAFIVLRRRSSAFLAEGTRDADSVDPGSSRPKAIRPLGGFLRRLLRWLDRVGMEMHSLGRSPRFYVSFGVSILIMAFQALAFWFVLVAYGLHLSVWVGAIVLLIVHLGTALPNAPGNVGTYQFFCVVGLTFFGIGKVQATGFSLVVFFILTVPLWLLGALAFARSGVNLRAIRQGGAGPDREASVTRQLGH